MALMVAGSLNLDLVGRAPRIPAPGETVLGSSLQRFHGGKGGNQAVAAARAGAKVHFAGAVGRDAAGDELLAGLQAEGIDTALVTRADASTGTALITVSDAGDNAITVLPGANLQAPQPTAAWPSDARWLLLQMEIPPATVAAWAAVARQAGARVMLNAAPVADVSRTLVAAVDLLLVNEGEARALTSFAVEAGPSPTSSSPEAPGLRQIAEHLAAWGPSCVVVTRGPQGCVAWSREERRWIGQPSVRVDVVDTTGAGDTFAGALAVALDEGRSLEEALRFASVAAALSCEAHGARGGMPRRAAIEAGLARCPAASPPAGQA